jgi:endoglucanase
MDAIFGTYKVTYTSYRWSAGFTTLVTLRNTGTTAISPWDLKWSFADDQKITDRWQAEISQSGRNVTVKPVDWNGTISPGASVNFGFNGTSAGQVADPKAFTVNGGTCDLGG